LRVLNWIRYSTVGVFFTGLISFLSGCSSEDNIRALLLLLLLLLPGGCNLNNEEDAGGQGQVNVIPPIVTTDAANTITSITATLTGTVNANGDSTTVTFEYGTTTAYGTTVTADQSPVAGTGNMSVSKNITALAPGTPYHYRVVGQNAGGTTNGGDMTFTTSNAAPTATTNAASAITSTTATLNGTINANGDSTTVTFEYGLTIAYGTTVTADQSPVTSSSNTAVSKGITGLTPNMLYHFRVVGQNGIGTTNGTDMTFTTSTAVPTVTTNAASAITTNTATLNGTVNANGASTTVTFEYGLTTAYGTTVTADQSPVSGTSNTAVSKGITGLIAGMEYHYRVVGQNGVGTANGADMTFTTTAAPFTIDEYGTAASIQLTCGGSSGNILQTPTDTIFVSRRVLAQGGTLSFGSGIVDIDIVDTTNLLTFNETSGNSCTMGNTRIIYPQTPPALIRFDLSAYTEVQYTSTLNVGGFSGATTCAQLLVSDGTNSARTALDTSTGTHTTALNTGSVNMAQVNEVGLEFGNVAGPGNCVILASTDFTMSPLVLNP